MIRSTASTFMECFMRRFYQLSMLCVAAGIASACRVEDVVKTEDIPTAGVRFINAVPDTGGAFGLDFRFIDIVENNAQFRVAFRNGPTTSNGITASTATEYKGARAGAARHFRVFLDDTLQNIAQTVLKDSTLNLEAGHLYTVLMWGSARSTGADKMRLTVIDETPNNPAGQVGLRVINATSAPIDVRQYVQGGTVPGAPTWANVPALGISSWLSVAPSLIMYNVQPAGGGATLFADQQALPGQAATVDIEATPGTNVAGSAVTLVVYPRSTAGARTPQTAAFAVPAGSFMWDKRPPRTCSPLC
jgi:hypothetical protein